MKLKRIRRVLTLSQLKSGSGSTGVGAILFYELSEELIEEGERVERNKVSALALRRRQLKTDSNLDSRSRGL